MGSAYLGVYEDGNIKVSWVPPANYRVINKTSERVVVRADADGKAVAVRRLDPGEDQGFELLLVDLQGVPMVASFSSGILPRVSSASPPAEQFLARWETCPKCNGKTEIEVSIRGPNYLPLKFECDKCAGARPGYVAVPVTEEVEG